MSKDPSRPLKLTTTSRGYIGSHTTRVGTVKRTGHWVACHPSGVYLRRRSTQPLLVWDSRAEASSFRTKREAEEAVRLSGYRGSATFENVAQTHAGFTAWRRECERDD